MSKANKLFIEQFQTDLKALEHAIEMKTFTKARRLCTNIAHFIQDYDDFNTLEVSQIDEIETKLLALNTRIPAKIRKPRKKSQREIDREEWYKFLYKNNTYQGPAS